MRPLKTINLIVALGFALAGVDAIAGKPTNAPPAGVTNAPPSQSKKGHNTEPPGVGRILHQPGNAQANGAAVLPADVNSLVQQFQKDQLKRQLLLDQLKQASSGDRAAIRDELKDLRDKLQDEHRQLEQEIHDRLQEIKTQLKNQRNEQLGDAGSSNGGHHQKH